MRVSVQLWKPRGTPCSNEEEVMEALQKWIQQHEAEFLNDLASWIRHPSISLKDTDSYPYGEACAAALEEALCCAERFGFETRNFENRCGTARLQGRTARSIGVLSHLDVVPEGNGWSQNPYEMTVQDGVLCGRGCADDKGPALAALYALRYLKESDYAFEHSICMFFGCNEEAGMEDVSYYLEQERNQPIFSIVPDARLSVCHGEKGHIVIHASRILDSEVLHTFSAGNVPNSVPGEAYAILKLPQEKVRSKLQSCAIPCALSEENGWTKMLIQGKAAHAAFPEGSVHAQERLARLLCASGLLDVQAEEAMRGVTAFLEDYYGTGLGIAFETPEFGKLTMACGIARLENNRFNMVFDVRYPAGLNTQVTRKTVEQRLGAYGFAIDRWLDSKGYYIDPNLPVIQKMKAICEHVWAREFPLYVMGGGTYARKMPNAVPFGPGLPRVSEEGSCGRGACHQPDEAIDLDVLRKAIEIYALTLPMLDRWSD